MIELDVALKLLNKHKDQNFGEFIDISKACGRYLVDDVVAVKDLPCFDNSALDGYAVKFNEQEHGYVIKDTIFAGEKRELSISGNECIKIMTGAKFPHGADSILRFEDSEIKGGLVYAIKNFKKGDAHRLKGEEISRGDILIKSDTKLEPTHIMLLASQGITKVKVKTKPTIAIYSSGDEIKEPWQVASDDEIYNANALGLSSLLLKNGFMSLYLGIIKDELAHTINSLKNALNFDIIICSGGASKGEADFMKEALNKLGFKAVFDGVKMRPGAPAKVYTNGKNMVFILPGNPMAAYLCGLVLLVPFLTQSENEKLKAVVKTPVKFKTGRVNFVLGSLKDGEFSVTNGNKYGSGMITPLTKSNAIYLSSSDENELLAGQEIFVIRIS